MQEVIKKIESMHFLDCHGHPLNLCKDWEDIKTSVTQIFHQEKLDELSVLMAKKFKDKDLGKWTAETLMLKHRILDHFTLAYVMDAELHPTQLQLTQDQEPDGSINIYFTKKSSIIQVVK